MPAFPGEPGNTDKTIPTYNLWDGLNNSTSWEKGSGGQWDSSASVSSATEQESCVIRECDLSM